MKSCDFLCLALLGIVSVYYDNLFTCSSQSWNVVLIAFVISSWIRIRKNVALTHPGWSGVSQSWTSLQCRRIWVAWVHIFVLGCHLGFSNSGGLGRGDIRRGSKWRKWVRGEGEGKKKILIFSPPLSRLCTKPLPAKHPVTIQDGGIEAIYLAFRIPLRNNACTAG